VIALAYSEKFLALAKDMISINPLSSVKVPFDVYESVNSNWYMM
jgi:hypothetical protein